MKTLLKTPTEVPAFGHVRVLHNAGLDRFLDLNQCLQFILMLQ